MKIKTPLVIIVTSLLVAGRLAASVVINEIFYHAPDDLDDLQWIELHNPDNQPVDISGWKLTKGLAFQFPAKTTIAPGGFVVICKNARLFAECYKATVTGEFSKSLKHRGDTLELVDGRGKRIDRVKFGSGDPWPVAPNGHSSSLERITPGAPGDQVENWAASPLPEDMQRPAGTPGRANASFAANFPPIISHLTVTPLQPTPGQSISVTARVEDSDGVAAVELRYRIARPGALGEEQVVAMKQMDGPAFHAEFPAPEAGTLIRVRIRAVDQKNSARIFPSPNDLRPAVSLFVQPPVEIAFIPHAQIINVEPREFAEMERIRQRSLRPNNSPLNNEQWQMQDLLQSGLKLSDAWFELTIRQTPDDSTYAGLKQVFTVMNTKRNALVEEAMASDKPSEVIAALPGRIKTFQDEFISAVKPVLATDKAATFENWVRERLKPAEGSMGDFLRGFLGIEEMWFGLLTRSEFTPAQREGLRACLQKAVQEREEVLRTVRGMPDFGPAQEKLGTVQEVMNKALEKLLSVRQQRALAHWRGAQGSPIRPRVTEPRPLSPRGNAAFVYVDAKTKQVEVFDFIHVTERSAGYKVRFHKDHPLNGMTTANVIFEYNDRFLMAEPLAYEVYRQAGNAACDTDFVRLSLNGHLLGYHLLIEQVNSAFLRRNKLNPEGDLFKILWYGLGIEGQHEKQNNPDHSYGELETLIRDLDNSSGNAQWEIIQKNFNMDQVMNYFAVNLVLSHWDGFFNNYFTLHDQKGSGKWEMYPWDQDKTWGFHDASGDKVFFDMPVTFGMKGDRPPGGGEPVFNPGSWWRPGGFFSKPLLANPEFRKRYLERVRKIIEVDYTEKNFFPIIDAMADRLKPEIPIRAKVIGEDPTVALARLERNVASFKEHLVKRRQFLLEQEEIVGLPR